MTSGCSERELETVSAALDSLDIETPSWGYADTGTRFGKFLQDAAAIDLRDKIRDAGQVHRFTGCAPAMAVHVLWDFPEGSDEAAIRKEAETKHIRIGSINPNLFQDQCYRLGSFGHPDADVRERAIAHCLDSIDLAGRLDSDAITLWFADGTNYPGQDDIRARKRRFEIGLARCHAALSSEQSLLVEYKPFEPSFYATDVADWGMAFLHAKKAGPQAKVLVDTGHHYSAQNIEQIVAWLLDEGMLGGFHFNDRRYADDDLTLGSIDPYQVFRIFVEIHAFAHDAHDRGGDLPEIAYMVDQSHNLKPKIEAMIQTVTTAQELWAKASIVDFDALRAHQARGQIVDAESELKRAFRIDVTDALHAWRKGRGIAAEPLEAFRASGYAEAAAKERKQRRMDLGLRSDSSYA